eukprot:6598894-Prymnesium_polylepis.1
MTARRALSGVGAFRLPARCHLQAPPSPSLCKCRRRPRPLSASAGAAVGRPRSPKGVHTCGSARALTRDALAARAADAPPPRCESITV